MPDLVNLEHLWCEMDAGAPGKKAPQPARRHPPRPGLTGSESPARYRAVRYRAVRYRAVRYRAVRRGEALIQRRCGLACTPAGSDTRASAPQPGAPSRPPAAPSGRTRASRDHRVNGRRPKNARLPRAAAKAEGRSRIPSPFRLCHRRARAAWCGDPQETGRVWPQTPKADADIGSGWKPQAVQPWEPAGLPEFSALSARGRKTINCLAVQSMRTAYGRTRA